MEQDKAHADKELLMAFDRAFDKPINLDHKPTPEELLVIRLRAVEDKVRQETLREVGEWLEKYNYHYQQNYIKIPESISPSPESYYVKIGEKYIERFKSGELPLKAGKITPAKRID